MSAALATGVTPAPVAAVQAHQPSASAAAQTSRAGNARQWVQYPFVAGGSRASVLGTITQADLNDMVTLDREPAVPTRFGCTAAPTIGRPQHHRGRRQPDRQRLRQPVVHGDPVGQEAAPGY
ncbi:MAG: hypothetical protein H6527_06255 [Actinobacteria bacterium]|nr:hypothetical protein [Actinomycetota bacterium]HRY08669.1 hypothetical protein [Candidatus Nanopelagicales bacterium]